MRSNLSHERDERSDVKCPQCGCDSELAVAHCPRCGINMAKTRPKTKKAQANMLKRAVGGKKCDHCGADNTLETPSCGNCGRKL